MDRRKCRDGGRGGVDWPPGRPEPWGLFEIFFLCFSDFFFGAEAGVFGGSFLELGEAGGLAVAGA